MFRALRGESFGSSRICGKASSTGPSPRIPRPKAQATKSHEGTRRHTKKSGSAQSQVIQGSALHPRLRGWLRRRWPSRLPGAGCATARDGMTAVAPRPLRVPSRQSFQRMCPAANPRAKRRFAPHLRARKGGSPYSRSTLSEGHTAPRGSLQIREEPIFSLRFNATVRPLPATKSSASRRPGWRWRCLPAGCPRGCACAGGVRRSSAPPCPWPPGGRW